MGAERARQSHAFSLSVSSPKRERETRANPCLLTPSAVTRGGGGIELGDWLGIEDGEREDAPNPAFLYRYARVVYLAGMTRTRLPRQKKVLFVGNFLTDVIRSAGNQHAMGIIDLRSTRCTAVRAVLPVTVTYTYLYTCTNAVAAQRAGAAKCGCPLQTLDWSTIEARPLIPLVIPFCYKGMFQ